METFSTTIRLETYRLFLALALEKGWVIRQYDVKYAFIYSPIDVEVFVIQPIGFEKGHRKVYKLKKALYGLKQSPRLWYEFLARILKAIGFVTLPYDCGAFIHVTRELVILCHVDDFLALGKSDAEIEEVLEEVSHKINLQDLGEVSTFLGIEFSLQREKPGPKKGPSDSASSSSDSEKGYSSLKLHQTRYVYHMLKRFGKEHLIPVSTPATEGIKL